jgi:hypothetical protein
MARRCLALQLRSASPWQLLRRRCSGKWWYAAIRKPSASRRRMPRSKETLVTLSNAFNVHYRSSTDLRKRLTGTYQGSLQKVVTQVLNGYDFFVGTGERRIEITLLRSSAASPGATPPVPTPALPTSGAAPVPRQGLAAAPLPAPSGSVPRPGPPIGGMTRSLPLAAR